jgi:hypothetical protein
MLRKRQILKNWPETRRSVTGSMAISRYFSSVWTCEPPKRVISTVFSTGVENCREIGAVQRKAATLTQPGKAGNGRAVVVSEIDTLFAG